MVSLQHAPVRVAHAIWLGSDLPVDYAAHLDQFEELNAPDGWTLQAWTDVAELRDLLPASIHRIWDDPLTYVPADSVYQFHSDIARLALLWRYGGLYIDTDFRWQLPVSTILDDNSDRITTVWELEGRFVANGFIYAPKPRMPIFRACLQDLPGRAHFRRGQRANRITGPSGQWTSICRRRNDVRILPSNLLIPYAWNELSRAGEDFPDAVGVHIWGHQQEIRGLR